MRKTLIIFFFSTFCCAGVSAQSMTAQQYIQEYKDLAVREMKRMGVPAAITLAQGLLETQNGNSDLVKTSNNHFGIKCKSTWTAETVSHDDDAAGECFRKYKSAEDSYRDHSNFLRGNSRYDFLFQLNPADYKAWSYGLRQAGYATNPRYPDILIKSIEDNNLEQYTMEAIGDVPVFDASKYKDDPVDNSVVSPDPEVNKQMNLTINGLKALYVPKGTSLLVIATENNINLSKLLTFNELTKDGILDKGQYLFLEKKQRDGNMDFCIAEPDETLYDIAQRNGVMLQSLYAYNHLTPDDYVVAGDKILLRPQADKKMMAAYASKAGAPYLKSDVSSSAIDTSSVNNSTTHKVLPKENLYSISKKYGVTVEQLKEWNQLSTDDLQIGQQLIISK
ncbi:MAG: glucosaminidase domain-containing protein [Ginsengibacter sp.]